NPREPEARPAAPRGPARALGPPVEDGLDLLAGEGPDDPVHELPAAEHEQSGDRCDPEPRRGQRILVRVQLRDADTPREVGRELFDRRREPEAWPAPGGPEVDEQDAAL